MQNEFFEIEFSLTLILTPLQELNFINFLWKCAEWCLLLKHVSDDRLIIFDEEDSVHENPKLQDKE